MFLMMGAYVEVNTLNNPHCNSNGFVMKGKMR